MKEKLYSEILSAIRNADYGRVGGNFKPSREWRERVEEEFKREVEVEK